jgi:hypothetical protein
MAVFEFGKRQRVETADASGILLADGDEGLRQTLVLMLTGDLPQPVVQLQATAVEALPVMAPS